jgi:hypothetical protein
MKQKFVIIHYPLLDFIIFQSQLSASAYLTEAYPVKCPNPYFPSLVIVNQDVLLLFDFNGFVRDVFRCPTNPDSRFLLVSDHRGFSLDSLLTIKKIKAQPEEIRVSYKHFALKTDSEVTFQTLETTEFKALPAALRKVYRVQGISGLRFAGTTLQYVLDLERLFMYVLCDHIEKVVAPL